MMEGLKGQTFLTAEFWHGIIPNENKKINYLEIGAHAGMNALSVCNYYGFHPESHLWCIDPWEDYTEYPEFKGKQDTIHANFCHNIKTCKLEDKITGIKGYSNIEIPKFEDNFFDIIYIDGNHEPEYALEDAVLSFRKLKVGGYLIFDDYGFNGAEGTQCGIDGFMKGYHKRVRVIETKWTTWGLAQVFLQKI